MMLDLRHDEGGDMVLQFTRSESIVPAPGVREAEFETPLALSTVKQGPRRTQVTFAIDKPATWRVRASNKLQDDVWSSWRQFLVLNQVAFEVTCANAPTYD